MQTASQTDDIQDYINYLCATDFTCFLKFECNFELGPQHQIWWEHLKTQDHVIEMAPRDHGKSFALARAYPLWLAKYHGEYYKEILLLGADRSAAIYNLSSIKDMIRDIPSLSYLYPNDKRLKNAESEFHLSNGVKIFARGFTARLRGRHPQLIILDDILHELNSLTEKARANVRSRFHGSIFPMADRGIVKEGQTQKYRSQIVMVGTAQHYQDLYHELLDNPYWRGIRLQAVIDEETQDVLWKARYSYRDLMIAKATIGTLQWTKEFQNKPIADSTSLFPEIIFEPCKDAGLSYINSYSGYDRVYMGVDFNIPGDTANDYTVITVMREHNDVFYIMHMHRFKATDYEQQIRAIESTYRAFGVTVGMVEDNLFQKIYQNMLRRANLNIEGHTVSFWSRNNLDTGVLALRPMIENRRLIFPYQTEQDRAMTDLVIGEFGGLVRRNGKIENAVGHDDTVFSIWHTISAAGEQSFKYEMIFDTSDASGNWWENPMAAPLEIPSEMFG